MIWNGHWLLKAAPIKDMLETKNTHESSNTSYGLTECGYDIRLAETIVFERDYFSGTDTHQVNDGHLSCGNFVLGSSMEEFDMPNNMIGYVKDKSTWARKGLSVFNTSIKPSWKGFLTLELVYHGLGRLVIPAGAGIAEVIFHQTMAHTSYDGKYQNQEAGPVKAR